MKKKELKAQIKEEALRKFKPGENYICAKTGHEFVFNGLLKVSIKLGNVYATDDAGFCYASLGTFSPNHTVTWAVVSQATLRARQLEEANKRYPVGVVLKGEDYYLRVREGGAKYGIRYFDSVIVPVDVIDWPVHKGIVPKNTYHAVKIGAGDWKEISKFDNEKLEEASIRYPKGNIFISDTGLKVKSIGKYQISVGMPCVLVSSYGIAGLFWVPVYNPNTYLWAESVKRKKISIITNGKAEAGSMVRQLKAKGINPDCHSSFLNLEGYSYGRLIFIFEEKVVIIPAPGSFEEHRNLVTPFGADLYEYNEAISLGIITDNKPLLITQDGIPKWEGDEYRRVAKRKNGEYNYNHTLLQPTHSVLKNKGDVFAFHNVSDAIEFCKKKNLKTIEIRTESGGLVSVGSDGTTVCNPPLSVIPVELLAEIEIALIKLSEPK